MPKIILPNKFLPLFSSPSNKLDALNAEYLEYCRQNGVCTEAALISAFESGDPKQLDALTYFDQQLDIITNTKAPEKKEEITQLKVMTTNAIDIELHRVLDALRNDVDDAAVGELLKDLEKQSILIDTPFETGKYAGHTMLHHEIFEDNNKSLVRLIKFGANINAAVDAPVPHKGFKPIHIAFCVSVQNLSRERTGNIDRHFAVLDTLIASGALNDTPPPHTQFASYSFLHFAIAQACQHALQTARLQGGSMEDTMNYLSEFLTRGPGMHYDIAILYLMNKHKLDINKPLTNNLKSNGLTPILVAATSANDLVVCILLFYGAKINDVIKSGPWKDCLPLVAASENKDALACLIRCGADLNAKCKSGEFTDYTAIEIAAVLGKNECIKNLKDAKANITEDALLQAARGGHPETLRLLLSLTKRSIDTQLKTCSTKGATLLYFASKNNSDIAVKTLLACGANVNAVMSNVSKSSSEYMSTALYIAAASGHINVVTVLLQHPGVIPTKFPSTATISPREAAIIGGHSKIAALLDEAIAKYLAHKNSSSTPNKKTRSKSQPDSKEHKLVNGNKHKKRRENKKKTSEAKQVQTTSKNSETLPDNSNASNTSSNELARLNLQISQTITLIPTLLARMTDRDFNNNSSELARKKRAELARDKSKCVEELRRLKKRYDQWVPQEDTEKEIESRSAFLDTLNQSKKWITDYLNDLHSFFESEKTAKNKQANKTAMTSNQKKTHIVNAVLQERKKTQVQIQIQGKKLGDKRKKREKAEERRKAEEKIMTSAPSVQPMPIVENVPTHTIQGGDMPQSQYAYSETKRPENAPAITNTTTAELNPGLQAKADSSLDYLVRIGVDPLRKYLDSALDELVRIKSLIDGPSSASQHTLSYTADERIVWTISVGTDFFVYTNPEIGKTPAHTLQALENAAKIVLEALVKNEKYFPYFLIRLDLHSDPIKIVRDLVYKNRDKLIATEYQHTRRGTYQSVRCYLEFHERILGEATMGFQEDYEEKARLAAYHHARTNIQSHIDNITYKSYSENYTRLSALYPSFNRYNASEMKTNDSVNTSSSTTMIVCALEHPRKTTKPVGYERERASRKLADLEIKALEFSRLTGLQSTPEVHSRYVFNAATRTPSQSNIRSVTQHSFYKAGLFGHIKKAQTHKSTKPRGYSNRHRKK